MFKTSHGNEFILKHFVFPKWVCCDGLASELIFWFLNFPRRVNLSQEIIFMNVNINGFCCLREGWKLKLENDLSWNVERPFLNPHFVSKNKNRNSKYFLLHINCLICTFFSDYVEQFVNWLPFIFLNVILLRIIEKPIYCYYSVTKFLVVTKPNPEFD